MAPAPIRATDYYSNVTPTRLRDRHMILHGCIGPSTPTVRLNELGKPTPAGNSRHAPLSERFLIEQSMTDCLSLKTILPTFNVRRRALTRFSVMSPPGMIGRLHSE